MSSLTVALFRAPDDAQATADALATRGLEVALAPVTEIVRLAAALPPGRFDFVVATSAKAFAAPAAPSPPPSGAEEGGRPAPETSRGERHPRPLPMTGEGEARAPAALAALPFYVVGERTAAAARRAGFAPEPPADDAAALIPRLPSGRALYLAGRDRKPELERALAGRIAVIEVYAAQARAGWTPQEALAVALAQAALHYSPRAASLAAAFAAAAGAGEAFRRLPHICLSREVAAPLAQAGASRLFWPQRPTETALLDTLESALAERR